MTNHNLAMQLKQIGLCALPTQIDDFIARVTKAARVNDFETLLERI
jgi:hypothetical protein